ncbi:hypothetical protein A0J61_03317 [Choanephora cucurbitarum]|uniref:Uncharacterized protein n=1 Tax=Choanephora cucurbitarum TaxID=101091 RepID=A0A1C7NJI6_9FUNG|nr:hypothetical protein A0J61_03317 [Choanephora cucurbitarum]
MSYSPEKEEKIPRNLPRLKTVIETPQQFLKLSRKITGIVSSKRPVEIQLGIGCGKNLLFPSLGTVKIEALLNQQNRLVGSKPMESPPTTPIPTPTHAYSISTISFDEYAPPQHSFPNRPAVLDRLVADVLNHLDSYPNQSDCSEDLIHLKPRLEAYHNKAF